MSILRDKVSELLERYEESSPAGKVLIIVQLRSAFQHASVQEGFDTIDSLHEEWQLNVLLGVGMRGVWYYYLAKRKGELMGL